jgi:transcriptional regulator with XRE-family HTH domain
MTPHEIYAQFGQLVREHRQALGMKQGALAEALGLSRTSITNIERGRQRIQLHQIFAVAEALAIEVDILLPRRRSSASGSGMETKLPKNLNLAERDWVHEVVGDAAKIRTSGRENGATNDRKPRKSASTGPSNKATTGTR